jgi:indolepyruvate decarboxylase
MRRSDQERSLSANAESKTPRYQRTSQEARVTNGSASSSVAMDALDPRYAAFIRPDDMVVLETGGTSLGMTPMTLPGGVRVKAQVLWGSIGRATAAALGVALADPNRRMASLYGSLDQPGSYIMSCL